MSTPGLSLSEDNFPYLLQRKTTKLIFIFPGKILFNCSMQSELLLKTFPDQLTVLI